MTEDLTDRQSRIVLLIWYAFLALLVIGAVLLVFSSSPGHAATVTVTISDIGNSTGHGLQSVSYSGQNLTAIIAQGMNNSTWNISAEGFP